MGVVHQAQRQPGRLSPALQIGPKTSPKARQTNGPSSHATLPTPAPTALPPIGTDTSAQQLKALYARATAMKPEDVQGVITQAANGGTEAMLVLGYFYRNHNGWTKSQQWFAEASKHNDPLAWAVYGLQLQPQQPKKRDWLLKAANRHRRWDPWPNVCQRYPSREVLFGNGGGPR
jgi:hypothetical protein